MKRRDWRSGLMGIWIDHKKTVVVSESIVRSKARQADRFADRGFEDRAANVALQ
jgi:hypothetical protein